jgi:hypothetical protein
MPRAHDQQPSLAACISLGSKDPPPQAETQPASPPAAASDEGKRLRSKRVKGEVPPTLAARRQTATLERKRRTKTCCIYYEESNCVHEVVGKLSELRDQFSSVILRMSHFPGENGEGTWIVFFVKEGIPVGPWEFIKSLTGGTHVRLNPPVDKTKSLITSFEGVVQNFPFVSEEQLKTNSLECHMLPQVIPACFLESSL